MAKIPRGGEEGILAIWGDRPDGVFHRIGVHLDAAVSEKYLQPIPVAMDVAELFAKARFGRSREDQITIREIVLANDAALMGQPEAEVGDHRGGLRLARGKTLFGPMATDAGLDLIEMGDAAQALGGDPGSVLLVNIMQLATLAGN